MNVTRQRLAAAIEIGIDAWQAGLNPPTDASVTALRSIGANATEFTCGSPSRCPLGQANLWGVVRGGMQFAYAFDRCFDDGGIHYTVVD